MCARLFNNLNLRQLKRISKCKVVRYEEKCQTSYNVGPNNYVACIRKLNTDKKNQNQQKEKKNLKKVDDIQQMVNRDEMIYDDEGYAANDLYVQIKKKYDKQVSEKKQDHNQLQKENLTDEQLQQLLSEPVENKQDEIEEDRVLEFMYWGIQAGSLNIINVRSEEAQLKQTFKNLVNSNRCVIIAQGYYQWSSKKSPHAFYNTKKDHMLMCGLYNSNDRIMILTRESFGQFEGIHNRMPVLIEENEIELWLNTQNEYVEVLYNLLLKRDKQIYNDITSYQCSTYVNNVRNTDINCLKNAVEFQSERKNPNNKEPKSYYQIQKELEQNQQLDQLAPEINNILIQDNQNNLQIQKNNADKDNNRIEQNKPQQNKEQNIEMNANQQNKQPLNYLMKYQKSNLKRKVQDEDEEEEEESDERKQELMNNKKIVTTNQNEMKQDFQEFFKSLKK